MLMKSDVTRITIDHDDAPSPQAWLHNDGLVWWDLDYIHNHFRRGGAMQMKRRHWLFWLRSKLEDYGCAGNVQLANHCEPIGDDVLNANVCTTLGLYTFFFISVDVCCDVASTLSLGYIQKSISRICRSTPPLQTFEIRLPGDSLVQMRPDCHCVGFPQFLRRGHASTCKMLEHEWATMLDSGVVVSSFNADTQSVADVIVFVSTAMRRRRRARHKRSGHAHATLQVVIKCLLNELPKYVDDFVNAFATNEAARAARPPPALRLRRGPNAQRQYTSVSAEAAWDILQRARAEKTDVHKAIGLRSDGAELGGCSAGLGLKWSSMALDMYHEKTKLIFGTAGAGGVHHWNIVSDPGTHSYKECLVSLMYSWELNAGCYPKWAHLVPGKALAPGEADLLDSVEEKRAQNKLERVASFRQLQGLSHQICSLSGERLTLDSFDPPVGSNLRAVSNNEVREVMPNAGMDLHVITNTATGQQHEVLPLDVTDVMLCIFQLDQGSVGCAGVPFASIHLGKMIEARFDKVHRLIRDLKGAEQECMGGIFNKCKFWSSYLLGLNNRPFNSGAHWTLKSRMLELFAIGNPKDKPVF